mgnify:CR=1 FL=1
MNKKVYFTNDSSLSKIWNYFPLHQGDLFHYTTQEAAQSIQTNNELFLTRSDFFLDKLEVKYGIDLLMNEATKYLKPEYLSLFENFISEIDQLRNCLYVICFTQMKNSTKHKKVYGESILQFSETFTTYTLAGTGNHSLKVSKNSYRMYHACDLYQSLEGFVIYEPLEQVKLARLIVEKFEDYQQNVTNLTNVHHLNKILLKYVLLTKQPSFAWEREFRFGFYSIHDYDSLFEENTGNGKVFIRIKHPPIEIKNRLNKI